LIELKKELNLNIREVNFLQDVFTHHESLDFNKLFYFVDRYEQGFIRKTDYSCKMKGFEKFEEGQQFEKVVKQTFDFKSVNIKHIDTYLFASYNKWGTTTNHADNDTTVFLIPTYGDVVYSVYDKTKQQFFVMKKGDLLVIPKGIVHSAIPLNPRIVVSVGIDNF
jgi:hypothetical protein